ncbi:MAG: cation-transporting P-type ATPase [Candidatus Heimdallarchaeota archaeon]|nr:MAG: cation-transporting P-type ATPase [Candidatus Heimdallarchaeota archaeon]
MEDNWYSIPREELLQKLKTNAEYGLSNVEIIKRQQTHGLNELQRGKKISPLSIFIQQFKNSLVLILLFALAISTIIGLLSEDDIQRFEYFIDSIAISMIILFNAIFGFIQEYKAEKSLEALESMVAHFTTVIREGEKERVESRNIVPGDIVLLEEGERIPADARILQSHSLRVDESALTGESFPVSKDGTVNVQLNVPIGDRINSIFKGTIITGGRVLAVITETGMKTVFGQIAESLLEEKKEETPLQRRLAILGKWLGIGSITICIGIFFIGVGLGQNIIDMLILSVGLAVAAVPEGLPAVVTIALALGVQRMSKKNAIIRRLPSVETLGSTTVICSDKTGTLTENKMIVRKILSIDQIFELSEELKGNSVVEQILTIGMECNNAVLDESGEEGKVGRAIGDPTEIALLKASNILKLVRSNKRVYEIPFNSTSKRMSVALKKSESECLIYTKGAPDVLLDLCEYYKANENIILLTEDIRDKIKFDLQNIAEKGYRLIGMAYKTISNEKADLKILCDNVEEIEARLIYVGAVAIIDPPREGTKKSIQVAKSAGIRPVMITGDHSRTAIAIANEIGLISDRDSTQVIEGIQLVKMTDTDLQNQAMKVSIFARVSPDHKLRIVSALKSNNQIVAMTGDGVNDAPALKKADIGIAMGITGTDVSKEASDMILVDDDFSTIIDAVKEGRTIYDNMRKLIIYLLSCNAGEIAVLLFGIVLTSIFFSIPIVPLLALQILWVNLVTDGIPALAMGIDPPDPDIMNNPPRNPQEPILPKKSIYFIVYSAILVAIGTLFIFFLVLSPYIGSDTIPTEEEVSHARTIAFTVLIAFQMVIALNIRKEHHSLFSKEFFKNPILLLAIMISISLHLFIIYLPILQPIFETTVLFLEDWILVIMLSTIFVVIEEFRNYIGRNIPSYQDLSGYW